MSAVCVPALLAQATCKVRALHKWARDVISHSRHAVDGHRRSLRMSGKDAGQGPGHSRARGGRGCSWRLGDYELTRGYFSMTLRNCPAITSAWPRCAYPKRAVVLCKGRARRLGRKLKKVARRALSHGLAMAVERVRGRTPPSPTSRAWPQPPRSTRLAVGRGGAGESLRKSGRGGGSVCSGTATRLFGARYPFADELHAASTLAAAARCERLRFRSACHGGLTSEAARPLTGGDGAVLTGGDTASAAANSRRALKVLLVCKRTHEKRYYATKRKCAARVEPRA